MTSINNTTPGHAGWLSWQRTLGTTHGGFSRRVSFFDGWLSSNWTNLTGLRTPLCAFVDPGQIITWPMDVILGLVQNCFHATNTLCHPRYSKCHYLPTSEKRLFLVFKVCPCVVNVRNPVLLKPCLWAAERLRMKYCEMVEINMSRDKQCSCSRNLVI